MNILRSCSFFSWLKHESNLYLKHLLLFSHKVMSDSFVTPWTVACQTPLFMGFSRQEYWRGLPFPSRVDLSDSGTETGSLASPALASGFLAVSHQGSP